MQVSQFSVVISIALTLNAIGIILPIAPSTRSLLAPTAAQTAGNEPMIYHLHLQNDLFRQPTVAPVESGIRRVPMPDNLLPYLTTPTGINHRHSDRSTQPPVVQAVNSRLAEASRLLDQGIQQFNSSQYQEAFRCWQQALAIYRESSIQGEQPLVSRNGEATALMNLGALHNRLNDSQHAVEYLQQALPIFQALNNRNGEADTLMNLGGAYKKLEQYQKSIEYAGKALSIYQEVGDRNGEAKALGNLGVAYSALGQYQRGLEYSEQALPIYQEVGDRSGEAKTLLNLGNSYEGLSGYQKGISYYRQALPIFRELGDRDAEGFLLANIGRLYANHDSPQSAIQFLQQSVEVRESIRKQMQQLPQTVQQSYVDSFASDYQLLADLLTQQSRRSEAQQILDLLKLQ